MGTPSRTGGKQSKSQGGPESASELASFSGVLRTMDKKDLLLKLADDHTLKFQRSGKTRFFRDSTRIKASEVHPGDLVTIEGKENMKGALEAVNVRLERDTAATPGPAAPNPK